MFDLMVNSPVSSSKVAFFFSGLLDFSHVVFLGIDKVKEVSSDGQ